MAAQWTIRTTLAAAADVLAKAGIDEARIDAERLLAHVLALTRIQLFADFDRPLDDAERGRFRALLLERANARLPVAYLVGRREFYGIELESTRDALVPRPETELLVDVALQELARRGKAVPPADLPSAHPERSAAPSEARSGAESKGRVDGPLIAEIGTGTGAIAIAVAKLAKGAPPRVIAIEKSPAAAALARRNVARTGLEGRVEVVEGDLLAPLLARGLEGKIDLLLSNPPYVALRERASLAPEVLAEPPLALFSGEDGLDAIRALVAGARGLLAPGGMLVIEHGASQGPAVAALARAAGLAGVETRRDLEGNDRLLVARVG